MYLRRRLCLIFLILYEIPGFSHSQEYLKDLRPKDIQFNVNQELPPVEIPRPLFFHRDGRAQDLDEIAAEDSEVSYTRRQMKSQRPTLVDVALEASVREGLNAMQRVYGVIEPDMLKNGHVLLDDHPAALLSRFSAPTVETSRREMAAYATLTAAKAFRKSYNLNNELARQAHTQKVSLRRTALESLCPPRDPPKCMPASERYRTHDGTCNNKRRSRWGAAQMPFSRFLPPEYADGVDSVRKASDGGVLSSSRFVSLLVHGARDGEAPLTLMLAQWGQLLDHDLTATAQPRSINGSVPSCCGTKDFHPSCFPIKVPLDDPWLSPLKVRCLEFLRSAPAQRRDCVLSWREQTNQATSYIDASPIYSNSVKLSDNARVFRNGLLIFGRGNPSDDVCQRGAIATQCIRSGDGRSGEQPGLLALHHVWVSEHNHIAMRLSEMNLHWSDEKIYQETRRIIGAMFQHITYREFLPIVLGKEVVRLFDLELMPAGYYEGYDHKTNPGVANAFSAAAFRFGHSLIQNSYIRCDRFHNVLGNNVSLHEEFQRGDIGSVGSLHRLIRGMATQRALKRDEFITPELTNHLFQTPGFPFGLDLAAINIQRGRDHGIPPYTHWRVPCGLSPISTWEEFAKVVGPESARRISHAYRNVNDIDLFVGGISERPVVGGLVGPTFACIIAQQFTNSRKGDRFWYENGGFESSFTPAQLHSIRKVTLSSVLCRAVGGGTFQPHIFLPPDVPDNERLPCGVRSLADIDLEPWLEQDPFKAIPLHIFSPSPEPEVELPRPTAASPAATFEPPVLDRIFEIVHSELETKSPDTLAMDGKVGFPNRQSGATKQPIFIAQKPAGVISSSAPGFQRNKNFTKINDKLDLKRKGTTTHVTKQKPLPGVSNKLDKHSRKGSHRHGSVQTTTRKTIIVNNVPIELRNAGQSTESVESRLGEVTLSNDEIGNAVTDIPKRDKEQDGTDESNEQLDTLEARTEELELPFVHVQSEKTARLSKTKEDENANDGKPKRFGLGVTENLKNLQLKLSDKIKLEQRTDYNDSTEVVGSENSKVVKTERDNMKTDYDEEITNATETFGQSDRVTTPTNEASNKDRTLPTSDSNVNDVDKFLPTSNKQTKFRRNDSKFALTSETNDRDRTEPASGLLTNQKDILSTTGDELTKLGLNNNIGPLNTDTTDRDTTKPVTDLNNRIIKRSDKVSDFIRTNHKSFTQTKADNGDGMSPQTSNLNDQLENTTAHIMYSTTGSSVKQIIQFTSTNDELSGLKLNSDEFVVRTKTEDRTKTEITRQKDRVNHSSDEPFKFGLNQLFLKTETNNGDRIESERNAIRSKVNRTKTNTASGSQLDNPEDKDTATLDQQFNMGLNEFIAKTDTNNEDQTKSDHSIADGTTPTSDRLTSIDVKTKFELNIETVKSDPFERLRKTNQTDRLRSKTDRLTLTTDELSNTEIDLKQSQTTNTDLTESDQRVTSLNETQVNAPTEKLPTQLIDKEIRPATHDLKTQHIQNFKISNIEHFTTTDLDKEIRPSTHDLKTQFKTTDSDIDPLMHSSAVEHKRVQRKLNIPAAIEHLHDKLKFKPGAKLNATKLSVKPTLVEDNTSVTKSPSLLKRTTLRKTELRQYPNRPPYTKAPQVLVDAANGDQQYQIEINIRQTNKSPKPQLSTPYDTYTTSYKTNPYDRYTASYPTFPSTTPLYGYYQPSPTQVALPLGQNQRTKPPTIIFLNEHEDQATTTRQPGFVHSIVGWSSGGRQPFPPETNLNERPTALSSPHSVGPQRHVYQNSNTGVVSSFSQAQLGNGVIQASTQAVSNGPYGTITGFANANGADSTFSFNIRPKPDKTQINRPQEVASYGYAQNPAQNWYSQKPTYGEHVAPYDIPYRENVHSPFSSGNSQTYYIVKKQRPQLKEDLTLYADPEIPDYDYLSRTRKPLHNITALDTDASDDEYDEDYGNSPLLRKFNQDGYLRPEHMLETLMRQQDEDKRDNDKTTTDTSQTLDDNYVLPAMNSTKDIPKDEGLLTHLDNELTTTEYPDSQGKQLNNDIFAEDLNRTEDNATDDDENDDGDLEDNDDRMILQELQKKRMNLLKRNQEKIAFAPITILTKPERPDNWLIYDTPKGADDTTLPKIPDLTMDFPPSAEIPKPIQENIWLSLAKIKTRIALKTFKHSNQSFNTTDTLLKTLNGTSLNAQTSNATAIKPNSNTSNETVFSRTEMTATEPELTKTNDKILKDIKTTGNMLSTTDLGSEVIKGITGKTDVMLNLTNTTND